ncbi:MAG: hypothetical protein ACOX8U_02475 [Bradymonadia bacterium]|jgi:hypothetical protein
MHDDFIASESKVFTRCIFFRHSNSTILEQQVNYFLSLAPLESLKDMHTNIIDGDILITLWIVPLAGATSVDRIYSEALDIARF